MDNWVTVAYIGVVLISFIICCCGDWPIFEGTPIQSINNCCTGGGFELLEKIVGFLCGQSGRHAVASVEYYCCDRPNPILQLFYFTILGGTYFAFVSTSFEYIPGHYVSAIHRYLGTWGVIMGAVLFLITSFSDPGTITAANVSDYLSVYPYDGILYEEKTCSTCNLARPARSKHCSICGRCVARFDHHCGWTNTCIGENNLRFFILFLFWHCCLSLYGAFVIAAILAGEVKKRNIIRRLTMNFGVEPTFQKLFPHIFQWLMAFYNEQLLILFFLVVISLLLMGFLGYHLYLVVTNTTTNETFKWESYKGWQNDALIQNHLKDAQEGKTTNMGDASFSDENVSKKRFKRVCTLSLFSRKPVAPWKGTLKRKNIYDKGIFQNFVEVFFPRSWQLWCKGFKSYKEKKL